MLRKDSLRQFELLATLAILLLGWPLFAQAEGLTRGAAPAAESGLRSLEQAAREGKYVFVFFWKQNDQQTQAMFRVFQTATKKMNAAANATSVNITDPKERGIVERYDLSRAPMPLVIAVAPNGAVTKGIPNSFTERQLQEAFVSNGTATCLKCLQDKKLVLLCVQHASTGGASNAFRGVREFAADPRFANSTDIVVVDANDRSEAGFLRSLQVEPSTATSQVVLLSPPGQPVAKFASTVTKEEIVTRVTSAGSGCCPGGQSAPGQPCCPGGQCGPSTTR